MERKVKSKIDFLGIKGDALVVSITEFIHDSGGHLTRSFWSLYVLSLGGSLGTLALLSAIQGLCSLVFQPVCGYLSDRIGRKKPTVIGGFIVAIGPFLNAFASHWTGLIPGQIIGTIDGGLWSVRQALFADSAEPERRGVGFASFFTIMQIGSIFMPVIGGILLDMEGMILGMRIGLIYAGSAKVIQSLLNAKFLTESVEANRKIEKPQKLKSKEAKKINFKSPIKDFFQPIYANKMLQVMVVGSAAGSFSMGLLRDFTVIYAVKYIGVSKTEWGIVQSAAGWVNLLTRIPFGRLTDKYGRRKFILISYFTRPVFSAFFVHSQSFPHVLASQSLSTLSTNVQSPAWQALMTDLTPAEERGRVYASFGMLRRAFNAFSPTIGALLWENYGPVWTFYTSILLRMVVAFFFYLSLKEQSLREK